MPGLSDKTASYSSTCLEQQSGLLLDNTRRFKIYRIRPGSDAVLHMSRIEFNELSSCEVQRLNQFETADIIRIGLAVLHAWLSRE